MPFVGVYNALYDYSPQGEGELELKENDLLLILDKSDDDGWWKAKKKALSETDDEPEGLIPNNYIEPATPIYRVKALYEYVRQTEEELSFSENDILDVLDTSDPDWTLAGLKGEFGFVPANYVEPISADRQSDAAPQSVAGAAAGAAAGASLAVAAAAAAASVKKIAHSREPTPPPMPPRPAMDDGGDDDDDDDDDGKVQPPPRISSGSRITPNNKIQPASSISIDTGSPASAPSRIVRFAPDNEQIVTKPSRTRNDHDDLDSARTPLSSSSENHSFLSSSRQSSSNVSPATGQAKDGDYITRGFKIYTIYQYKKAAGKEVKVPFMLGISIPKAMILTSDLSTSNTREQIWEGTKMTNYSAEGKVLFIDLVKPSESYHLHCGNTETAREIMALLGEIAGVSRMGGMEDVIAAVEGPCKTTMGRVSSTASPTQYSGLELDAGEVVVVLDADQKEEWWRVQKVTGDESGIVHKSIIDLLSPSEIRVVEKQIKDGTYSVGRSTRSSSSKDQTSPSRSLPKRASSLYNKNDSIAPQRTSSTRQPSNRDSRYHSGKKEREKPESSKVRVWTDRTGTFNVEAQFLGIRDGKIHLHKMNGVQIAVPVSKMSLEDIEYVERKASVSLDEDKPLSEIRRKASTLEARSSKPGKAAAEAESQYDWFTFFLGCGVNPHICERYAKAFKQDQMSEDQLVDINEKLLKNLGVKEGDVIRVMKFLDNKFDRPSGGENTTGSLFSGPGGTLHNNTKKGRPSAPSGPDSNKVNSDALKPNNSSASPTTNSEQQPPPRPNSSSAEIDLLGFDDDAWSSWPSKDAQKDRETASVLADPSIVTPLQAIKVEHTGTQQAVPSTTIPTTTVTAAPPQQQIPTGATPDLFNRVAQLSINDNSNQVQTQLPTGSIQLPVQTGLGPPPNMQPNITGLAPPGSTLLEISQQRMAASLQQQQQQQQQQQHTGAMMQQMYPMQQQNTAFSHMPQQTMMATTMGPQMPVNTGMQMMGIPYGPQFMGNQTGSPFADPFMVQHTGFQPNPAGFPPGPQAQFQTAMMTGLQPQPMMMQPQATGISQFVSPAMLQQASMPQPSNTPPLSVTTPLVPAKPAPNVKFGIGASKTGRQKANLAQATPDNPFGF